MVKWSFWTVHVYKYVILSTAAGKALKCLHLTTDFLLRHQMGEVWNELQPKLGCLFGGNNGLKRPIWNLKNTEVEGGGNTAADEDHKLEKNFKKLRMHNLSSSYYTVYIPLNKRIVNVNGFSTSRLISGVWSSTM